MYLMCRCQYSAGQNGLRSMATIFMHGSMIIPRAKANVQTCIKASGCSTRATEESMWYMHELRGFQVRDAHVNFNL
jgi:hypothetical protein